MGMTHLILVWIMLVSACGQSTSQKPKSVKNPREILGAADAAADAGDHLTAIEQYRSVLTLSGLPQMLKSAVQFNLGLNLRASSQWEQARLAFTTALVPMTVADGERMSDAHRQVAEVSVALQDWSVAADHFAAALKAFALPPLDATLLLQSLGAARLNAGDPELAVRAYEEAAANAEATKKGAQTRHPEALDSSLATAGSQQGLSQMHAEWGVALALLGRREEASEVLSKLPETSSSVGVHSFVGLRLSEFAPALAARHLELAIVAGEPKSPASSVVLRAVYDRLIRIYASNGHREKSEALVAKAMALGIWQRTDQRPGYLYPKKTLTARPWWSDESASFENLKLLDPTEALWRTARDMVANFSTLRHELVPEVSSSPAISSSAETSEDETFAPLTAGSIDDNQGLLQTELTSDVEHVADQGKWTQLEFVQNGHWVLPSNARSRYPATTAFLESLLAPGGAAEALPKASMLLSFLAPGTHLRPHCGPTNHRLRLHLPLVVPNSQDNFDHDHLGSHGYPEVPRPTRQSLLEQKGTRLRVGNVTREWREGEVAVFDDSFEHEAWNDHRHRVRSVLLVDVWHPELTEEEREAVRRDFNYARTSRTSDDARIGKEATSGLATARNPKKKRGKKSPSSSEL